MLPPTIKAFLVPLEEVFKAVVSFKSDIMLWVLFNLSKSPDKNFIKIELILIFSKCWFLFYHCVWIAPDTVQIIEIDWKVWRRMWYWMIIIQIKILHFCFFGESALKDIIEELLPSSKFWPTNSILDLNFIDDGANSVCFGFLDGQHWEVELI